MNELFGAKQMELRLSPPHFFFLHTDEMQNPSGILLQDRVLRSQYRLRHRLVAGSFSDQSAQCRLEVTSCIRPLKYR